MTKTIKIILSISLILFFQIGIFPHLKIFGVYPNLILISIIALGILRGFKETLIWAIIGGLFLDFYSFNSIFGISLICLIVVSFVAFFIVQNIFKKTNSSSVALIFLITVTLYDLLLLVFYKILGIEFEFTFVKLIINVFYNAIIAMPVFYALKKLFPSRNI